MFSGLTSNNNVTASLQVEGIHGGQLSLTQTNYHVNTQLIDHPEVVEPGKNFSVQIKNLALYSFTHLNLHAFSTNCSFDITPDNTEYNCTIHPYAPGVSKVTLTAGSDFIHSWVAAVLPLPSSVVLSCPSHVTASRHSQTLVSVDLNGKDYKEYFAYFTWYLDGQKLGYTAQPHFLYHMTQERTYSLRVVVTNHWGSREDDCQLLSVRPLIELEVLPTPVHKLTESKLLQTHQPTTLTILVHGPETLSNLSVNYGDGSSELYTADYIPRLNWRYVDPSHNSITLEHDYTQDIQYKVEVSASTAEETRTATGIVYRSVAGIHHRIIGKPHYQVNYEEGDTAVLMTEVESADYLSFDWSSDTSLQVIETTANYSKARVMFEKLGRPNIFCKILHPAYPDGIQVDFGELALVVITPADLAVQALVNGKEVNTVQLEGHPVLVTFRLKYLYGPNGTQVLLYDDVHKIHAETVGLCPDNIFLIVCEASISDTFTKAGRYNITMSVAVGNEVEAASTVLTILPPTNVLRFLNPHRVVSDLPVFYFPFGDMATLSLQFETAVLTNNTVRYSCSFGDQAQEITVDTGTTLNVSHKYMSTREAGFNVFVKATSAGVTVNASARVIIYKPIQRVELLAKGQGWTENNQGIIHFTPDQVENGLLLQLRVEPEDTPFSSCHILKGEVPGSSIVKSFLPENSNISMYYYDHTFTNIQQKGVNPRKLIVSAMCREARPQDTPANDVFSNPLNVYATPPIQSLKYVLNTPPTHSMRVGENLTFICFGPQSGTHYIHYLDGEKVEEGIDQSFLMFLPQTERIYNLTCVANNGINEMSHTSLLPILNQTCFVSLDIRPKTTKLSETSSWFRSEAVTLQAAFQREVCSSKNFQLSWIITNMADDRIVRGLDLPPVDDLFLPPRTLAVGNYTATFKVSVPDTVFEQTATLSFTILKTPFRAVIQGGVGRKIDLTIPQLIELDGSDSLDPDCSTDCRDQLEYIWACNVLKQFDRPCFKGRLQGDIEFAKGKIIQVNTSDVVEGVLGLNFVLVVFRGNESVVANQVWEHVGFGLASGSHTLKSNAICKTCTDGLDSLSSPSRQVVLDAACPPSATDCAAVKYSWQLFNLPESTAVQLIPKPHCSVVEARRVQTSADSAKTSSPTSTVATTTQPTLSPTTTLTTLAAGGFGGGFLQPTEEETDEEGAVRPSHDFYLPEEGGSGTDFIPIELGEGGISTTRSSIYDGVDFTDPYLFGVHTSRTPLTTTEPSATTQPSLMVLPGCGCAIDGDTVISTYNATVYEVYRVSVDLYGKTTHGSQSKILVINPRQLKSLGSYIVELKTVSGTDVSLDYYLLKTGDTPSDPTCHFSYSKRDANGKVQVFYDFAENGVELDRVYGYECYVPNKPTKGTSSHHEYTYSFEMYIERVPGELELVMFYRKHIDGVTGPQRLPAGYSEHNYAVNLHLVTVDMFGNRRATCRQPHIVLPQNYTLNKTATDAMHSLVNWSHELDWYDETRSWGGVFTIRTNILAVSEVLNRVVQTEDSLAHVQQRTTTRSQLLSQLISTPHRYMAEVEQKLVVLKYIVKVKSELDDNSTMKAMDLLADLVRAFVDYAPTDRPRNVTATTNLVLTISSQLMRCVSSATSEVLRNTYSDSRKLDYAINSMIMASLNTDYVPTAKHIVSDVNGMTIVSHKHTRVRDETISHGNVSFTIPSKLLEHTQGIKDCYSTTMMQYPVNPFKAGVHSAVTSINVFDCDGKEITDIRTDDPEAHVGFAVPSLHNEVSDSQVLHTLHKANMNIHSLDISRSKDRFLNLVLEFEPVEGHTFPITILIRKGSPPTPHAGGWDKKLTVYSQDRHVKLFLDDGELSSARKMYVGLADVKFNEGKPRERQVKERNYTMTSWWSDCVYWDTLIHDWSTQGCRVTSDTTLAMTHCSCSHMTAFATRQEVVRVKVTKEKVEDYFKLEYYPTTVVIVSIIVLTYVVLAAVSYMADRKCPVQERVIPIQDNSSTDTQRYIITLETGSEPGSGTTAKVSMVLHGEIGMSETRELVGPEDCQVFQTNSRDTFLLTLPASIGPIWKVQLWHDNKGGSPGWYVKRVTVRDIEHGQSYYFLCERWLAVEEQDGKVEREFMALDSHIGFNVVFKVKAPQYFNDYHLIRSLVYKPTYSHFSRVERLTCVFVGLLAHMALCTAYYYVEVEEYRGQYNLFDLSSNTVVVSLAVNAMACPLMLALSMLFRRSSIGGRSASRSKYSKKGVLGPKACESGLEGVDLNGEAPAPGSHSFLEQSILHWQSLQQWAQKQWEKRYQKTMLAGEEMNSVEAQVQEQVLTMNSTQTGGLLGGHVDQPRVSSQSDVKHLLTHSDTDSTTTSSQGTSSVHSFVVSRKWVLPPWFRFVAWFLSFACASSCGYCTVHYSYQFQEGRFVLWLQSIFVTFLFCNFLIQPFGILMKAVGTAIVFRKDPTVLQHFPDRYEEDIEEIRLRSAFLSDEDEITRGTRARQRSRYLRFARPPQEKQLIAARKRTMKERKLSRLGAECAVLTLLLTLVLIIVFCCDRNSSFHLNTNLRALLATNDITARHQSFVDISKPEDMWQWLGSDLADLLFTNHSLNLGASIIIGNASRIKQVRVQKETCVARDRMPSWVMGDTCYPPYSAYTNDKKPMRVSNLTVPYTKVASTAETVLHGRLTHYGGSGYDILLPVTKQPFLDYLEKLKTAGWVDRQTRAVFIEFTVYNIPTHLYSSVTAFFEFSPSGQVLPQLEVDSAILYKYRSDRGYVVLTCELLFIFVYLCQLHFHIVTILQKKRKYFTQIWNILETLYLLFSMAYIVLYLFRYEIVETLHTELTQTFHSSFVSVAPLVFWDRLLRLVLSLLLFILLVKILKLFRYVKMFARFGNVYRRAARDIRAFAVFFFLLTIMYTNVGVALFQSVSLPFSDYWRGMMTVTAALTGSASFADFKDTMPYLGGVYLVAVTCTAGGVLYALMASILSFHLRDFRQDPILAMDIKEALCFLFNKSFCGSKANKEKEEDDSTSQDLSPEFALAEMEYQVEELLFKMSALCDGASPRHKPGLYYTPAESDNTGGVVSEEGDSGGVSMALAGVTDKIEDVNSLSRLLHLQGIGSGITDAHTYNRSQLEMDVLRQLQLSHGRDMGIGVWDNLRSVRVERPLSGDLNCSEGEVEMHGPEYNNPAFHSYQGAGSDDDDDSFISIPDESHVPFSTYRLTPSPPTKHKSEKSKRGKSGVKQSTSAEVYELAEHHQRPLSPQIAYHNDAYVSDVEVEVDIEYTESPPPRSRLRRKSRSGRNHGAYQNPAYQDDSVQQTPV